MSYGYYNQNADKFIKDTINLDMTKHYQPFLSKLKIGNKILDAGCGSGRDTLNFINLGYSVDAFDASREMVAVASRLTGATVLEMTFENLMLSEQYNGIWACASLLHVKRSNLVGVLKTLADLLNDKGVLYTSFKHGQEERQKGDRYFNDMNEQLIKSYIGLINNLELSDIWISADERADRSKESWLNCIITKV